MKKEMLNQIQIDFEDEIMYGRDQIYNSYPAVFPTVTFSLKDTDGLVEEASKVTGKQDEAYSFYIGICGLPDRKVENAISFDDGNDETGLIDLSEDEQDEVWKILDAQCREKLGKSCDELLEEAKEKMND